MRFAFCRKFSAKTVALTVRFVLRAISILVKIYLAQSQSLPAALGVIKLLTRGAFVCGFVRQIFRVGCFTQTVLSLRFRDRKIRFFTRLLFARGRLARLAVRTLRRIENYLVSAVVPRKVNFTHNLYFGKNSFAQPKRTVFRPPICFA